jgi:hypothetical protein
MDGRVDPELMLLFTGRDDNVFAAAIMNGSFGEARRPSRTTGKGRVRHPRVASVSFVFTAGKV